MIVYGDAEVESMVDAMLESVATRVRATDPASCTDRAQWPAIAPAFELSKFKVATHSGAALLWKFTGFGPLGAVPIAEQLDTERDSVGHPPR